MGNNVITWGCCQSSFHQNRSEEYEIKKNEKSDRYPVFLNQSLSSSHESVDKGYIYVPEDISSIDFPVLSEDGIIKDLKSPAFDNTDNKANPQTFSLGTIEEVSNSEVHDMFSSNFFDTQEIIKKDVKTSQSISKVLDFKLSDSFSCRDSDFDQKLGTL